MKKIIKLKESDLMRIVKRVIKEEEDRASSPGKYFTLGGFHFYVTNGKMYLADKSSGELAPNLMIEFPSTKEISAVWTRNTKEIDIT